MNYEKMLRYLSGKDIGGALHSNLETMSTTQETLEQLRRDMYDAVKDRIAEHGFRVIRNDVGTHSKHGTQLVIIIQPEEKNE